MVKTFEAQVEKILADYWPGIEYVKLPPSIQREVNQAKSALLAAHQAELRRVIGRDEYAASWDNRIFELKRRNKLRAEQRKRAGIEPEEK